MLEKRIIMNSWKKLFNLGKENFVDWLKIGLKQKEKKPFEENQSNIFCNKVSLLIHIGIRNKQIVGDNYNNNYFLTAKYILEFIKNQIDHLIYRQILYV